MVNNVVLVFDPRGYRCNVRSRHGEDDNQSGIECEEGLCSVLASRSPAYVSYDEYRSECGTPNGPPGRSIVHMPADR
jgi:hypothetical protein